mmetsp:Transcript_7799/g.18576  ORF Transcript_7799/g.18576 Transcript_7799/m.18576 type:complete len:214 (-) Transcript_7799:1062-1703(-)
MHEREHGLLRKFSKPVCLADRVEAVERLEAIGRDLGPIVDLRHPTQDRQRVAKIDFLQVNVERSIKPLMELNVGVREDTARVVVCMLARDRSHDALHRSREPLHDDHATVAVDDVKPAHDVQRTRVRRCHFFLGKLIAPERTLDILKRCVVHLVHGGNDRLQHALVLVLEREHDAREGTRLECGRPDDLTRVLLQGAVGPMEPHLQPQRRVGR